MLAEAAETGRPSGRSRRRSRAPTATTARCSRRRTSTSCSIGTPDHWHALPMIAAVEAGADVYVQKPISVDVVEGQAMVAAARKHKRVVQVGTQRRSTPHLVEAREKRHQGGQARQDRPRRGLLLLPHAGQRQPAGQQAAGVPRLRDVDRPGRCAYDAPPYERRRLPHRRWWRAFMEYGNGIIGDMCIHMLDMVRWMLDLGWPKRITSTGGILVQKDGKSNITDTQTATFDFADFQVVWQHRTWGNPADPEYPWARDDLRRQGHAQGQRQQLRLHPAGQEGADAERQGRVRAGQVPRGQDREGPGAARRRRPTGRTMQDFLKAIAEPRQAGRRHRAGPHLDGELHPGEPVDASWAAR